jgi:hypothetical protein
VIQALRELLEVDFCPQDAMRKRLKTLAKYKLLLIEWQKSQKEAGKNTKPGEGTRNRLMKIAKEWYDSMNPQKIGQFEVGKIYTYTNKKGEKKKVGAKIREDNNRVKLPYWLGRHNYVRNNLDWSKNQIFYFSTVHHKQGWQDPTVFGPWHSNLRPHLTLIGLYQGVFWL